MADVFDFHQYKFVFIVTLLVLVLFNPFTFKTVHSLLKSLVKVSSVEGCPTTSGLLVHALGILCLTKSTHENGSSTINETNTVSIFSKSGSFLRIFCI